MDQRQYRADQPCDDAVVVPCADWDQPRDFLGRTQMNWVKDQLRSSDAVWKVMANELMVMPAKVLGGAFFTFDNWQGYPREREELLTFIRDRQINDVVFVTGDIHTFIAGDVRTAMGEGDLVGLEFVGGSITSLNLGESDIPAGGGVTIEGNDANPSTDPAIIEALRGFNPWVDAADFDHARLRQGHGDPGELRLRAGARGDDQAAHDADAALRWVPLAGGPRADIHQGRQRPARDATGAMNRRQFVTAAGSAAAAAVLAPPAWAGGGGRAAPLARGGRFAEGVMSGEPTPRSIALWTRVHDLEGRVAVDLEVARDRGFDRVVARRRLTTSEARGHAVKARLDGLRPHEQYFYRFSTATREGPVGRFRTALPADSQQPVRFAFYSCQEYAHGFYNAHEVLARDDLDFVVCLGDYIYADAELVGRARRRRARRRGRPRDRRPALRVLAGGLPPQVRAVPLGRGAAQGAAALPDRADLGRPRGAEQLRRRRARRRPAGRARLQPRAAARGLPCLLRVVALHAPAPRSHLPLAVLRPHGRPDPHGPAPVPR